MRLTLQLAAYGGLVLCWVAWTLAFVRPRREAAGRKKAMRAPVSRWGIFLNFLGFACVSAYVRPAGFVKSAPELVASLVLGPLSVLLAWAATRHLGKHWRYEAALSADHQLVKTGPYAWIRHPIYASMMGMLLATGLAHTWWPMLIAGTALFLAGIEIRIHAEESLLEMYFQDEFIEYRSRVRRYLPFIH